MSPRLKCPIRSTNKRFLLNTLRSTTLQRRPAGQPREQHSPAAERQRPRGEESDSDSGRDRTGGSAVAAAAWHREGKERGHKRDSIKERSPPRRHSESSHCGRSPPRRHSSHCGSSPEGYSGRHPMTSSHRPHSHSRSRSRSPVRGRNSAHNSSSSAADKHSHSTSHK